MESKTWSTYLEGLPALSVRQPWASMIVEGHKDIENRTRRTTRRGRVLIHAGLNVRNFAADCASIAERHGIIVPTSVIDDVGGIIGVVDIIDCVADHPSRWRTSEAGKFGWVLGSPRRLAFRRCRGALGFFRIE
jgi:hypothetical protein